MGRCWGGAAVRTAAHLGAGRRCGPGCSPRSTALPAGVRRRAGPGSIRPRRPAARPDPHAPPPSRLPPRAAAAPHAPGTPPARRPAARAVTHRATRVMHSRARERSRQRHTLPHCHSHTGPLATSHTLSTFTLSRCHSFVRGQSGSNLRTVCHTQSFVVFSSLECACRVIHCDTHSDIATTNSDTHISPVVSHVVTNTVNSVLQGHTLITHIQPPPQ